MSWKKEEGKLVKEFEFNDFKEAIDFVNKIFPIAQEQNHHPDILIHSYKKVKVIIYTHDEDRITEEDHKLSESIESIQ